MSGETVRKARAEADAARATLIDSARALQSRLSPATVARMARESVRESGDAAAEKAARIITERPAITSAALVGVAAFLARRPIARLFRRREDEEDDISDTGTRTRKARRPRGDRA